MKDIFKNIILILVIIMLQFLVINNNNILSFKPNLFFCFLIAICFRYSLKTSLIYTIILGMFLDIIYLNSYVKYTIIFMIVFATLMYLKDLYRKEIDSSIIYFTIISSVEYSISLCILNISNFSFWYMILSSIFSILFNLVIVYIINNYLKEKGEEYKKYN